MIMFLNVDLDITNNCNFKCAHCLRGEAENNNLNLNVLPKLFNSKVIIQNLQLMGGEIFLAKGTLEKVISYIINNDINIFHVSIVSNGTCYTKEFENIFNELDNHIKKMQMYCFGIMIPNSIDFELSVDKYHKIELNKVRENNYELYRDYKENINRFVSSRFFLDYRDNEFIYNTGRAKNLDIEKYEEFIPKYLYTDNSIFGFKVMEASILRIDVYGNVYRTDDSVLSSSLNNIIKKNYERCLNESDFTNKYLENLNSCKKLKLVKN